MSTQVPKKAGRPTDVGKREAIVAAATRAFFDAGYAATSIEQVAQDAAVSKVTIYNHFGDKRALFTAAVEAECERISGHFRIEPAPNGSLRDRLTAIGEGMVAFLSRQEMVQFERRIAAETEHDPAIGEAFLKAGPHRMKAAFSALLTAMDEAGELRIEDPLLAAEQFASLCKGMGDLDRRFGRPNDSEYNRRRIAAAVDMFLARYAPG